MRRSNNNQQQRSKKKKDPYIDLLKDYLSQYQRAKNRKKYLEGRLDEIMEDIEKPIKGINYDPIIKPQNKISNGSASYTLQKANIEQRIYAQSDKITEKLIEVMDVLDYLDENSDERNALELYYIDGKKWEQAAEEMCVSRSTIFRLQDNGIKKLLKYSRVKKLLDNYRKKEGVR